MTLCIGSKSEPEVTVRTGSKSELEVTRWVFYLSESNLAPFTANEPTCNMIYGIGDEHNVDSDSDSEGNSDGHDGGRAQA